MAYKLNCPECGRKAFSTGRNNLTNEASELYFACSDKDGCGHTFVMSLSFVFKHSINPARRNRIKAAADMLKALSPGELHELITNHIQLSQL